MLFRSDAKGSGATGASKFKATVKGTTTWQISATLKGDFDGAWRADGLVNATVTKLVTLPVVVYFGAPGAAAFYQSKTLTYRATIGGTGTAK